MTFQKGVIFTLLRDRIGMNCLPLNFGIKVADKIFDLIVADGTDVKSCLIAHKRCLDALERQIEGVLERNFL